MLHRTNAAQRGHSLIELLIVAAVIAVLAGMLLPAVSLARRMAKSASCATNQQQMFLALRMYADDNRSQFPPIRYEGGGIESMWWGVIASYADRRDGGEDNVGITRSKTTWNCPEYRIGNTFTVTALQAGAQSQAPGLGIIDRINASVSTYVTLPGNPNAAIYNKRIRWSDFAAPTARRVIAGDSVGYNLYARKQGGVFSFGRDTSNFFSSGAPSRHSDPTRIHGAPGERDYRANYLHADGHVETLSEPIAAARAKLDEASPP